MTESELYKELGELTKDKERWKESIPYVSSFLTHDSVKIQAKALWLLGEMGLANPQSVKDAVAMVVSFLDNPEPLLRERAVNALGRIGRAGDLPRPRQAQTGVRKTLSGTAAADIRNRREQRRKDTLPWCDKGGRIEIEISKYSLLAGINSNRNSQNNADGDYGYAHMTWYSVILSRLTRTCNRCGYDPLWKPNDDDSKCLRHTYNSWRYDEVFVWSPTDNHLTLEEAFDIWLQSQPTSINQPVKKMTFGQIGWK